MIRCAAIGDSFSEGMGDELPDGSVRGWADLVVGELASQRAEPVEYANYSVRGLTLDRIIDEHLGSALDLGPELLLFAGGGNDAMWFGFDPAAMIARFEELARRSHERGARLVMVGYAPVNAAVPLSRRFAGIAQNSRELIRDFAALHGVEYVDNSSDLELGRVEYASADRVHLNVFGHRRVAANVLTVVGLAAPAEWLEPAPPQLRPLSALDHLAYLGGTVAPWARRRALRPWFPVRAPRKHDALRVVTGGVLPVPVPRALDPDRA